MKTVDRILATSDLHGQNKRFLDLLRKTEYNAEQDLLIVCGDLIDRGNENLDCLATCEALQKKGAVLLKGNHEQFLEKSLIEMLTTDTWRERPSNDLYYWIHHNGGREMYEEIKNISSEKLANILKFIQSLPAHMVVGKYIFSHAGANSNKPIEENTEDELVWMSKEFPWCPAYAGKIMVFGHTPTWVLYGSKIVKDKKNATVWYDKINKDKLCVDCGGIFGGRLAAIELPTFLEFYN